MLHSKARRERADLALLRRYRSTGDPIALEQLTERLLPLVQSLARRFHGRGEDSEDVLQAGLVGLTKAIERYDLESGHRFVSYAAPNITGEIRRHFRDHTWAVHVPRQLQELDAKVQVAIRETEAATGREPTDDELAQQLALEPEQIREARVVGRSYRATSLDAPAGDGLATIDRHGRRDQGFDLVENRLLLDRAERVLSVRERRILKRRFDDELLQREIAKEFGVSQMQISRIITGAVTKMRTHLNRGPTAS